jgi:Protein containing von Willebrand factor type A (vWA) domain
MTFRSIDDLHEALRGKRYFASRGLTTTMFLALRLGRPIFLEGYTRLLLLFTYGLARALEQKVEAFVFSTRLTRITRQLRDRNLDRALREVSHAVPDWSGGTRIGEALRSFNFEWGRRVLGHGALTLVISDGWDCGEPSVLRDEIARLQRSSRRLIWLNPLLGAPEYEPLTRGIQTALPYIDDFMPVHNLASLEELAEHLGGLSERRPQRKQQAGVGQPLQRG